MKYGIYSGIVAGVVFILAPAMANAADLVVVCAKNNGACGVVSGAGPLFNENNMVPGQTEQRDIRVENSRDESCELELKASNVAEAQPGMAEKITARFAFENDVAYDGNLRDLSMEGAHMGAVAAGEENNYVLTMGFDISAGNEFQGKHLSFDFDFIFTCESAGEDGVPPVGSVAGATDKKEDKDSGVSAEKIPSVLGMSTFPKAGTPAGRFVSFFLIGLIFLLSIARFAMPKPEKI